MNSVGTHAVKVKMAGRKRREFLKPNGALTHLRVHALVTTEARAREIADHLPCDNDGVESAEAVAFWPDASADC